MATIADLIGNSLQQTGPGVKGAPGQMPPEEIGRRLLESPGQKVIPEEKGWLPSWSKGPAAIAGGGLTTIAGLIAKAGGKRLFTKSRKIQGMTYRERASGVAIDLKDRGYSETDIQTVLDILAQGYGEEPINAADATDVSGPLGGGVRE